MTRIVCLIVAGWAGAATLQADPPLLVGDLGDVQKMDFSGNEAFSTEAIRNGLAFQMELLPAARKLAPLSSLLDVVRDLVTRGYLNQGFADVAVDTAFDEQTSHIVEGTRYQEGEVRFTGIGIAVVSRIHSSAVDDAEPAEAFLADPEQQTFRNGDRLVVGFD